MEAEIAISGETLTASHYWVVTFKLGEVNTDFNQENRKKILTIAIYDIAQTCKNNTLKKLKHGDIVKPVFKYIKDRL